MIEEFEKYRKENRINQNRMAEMIGIGSMTYKNWISGKTRKPSCFIADKLIQFYDKNIKKEHIVPIQEEPVVIPRASFTVKNKRRMERVQLCDATELIQELKDGNTVYVTDTDYKLKLVDGFIVRYIGDDAVSINAPILTSEQYHIYRTIPVSLKVGGRYKTDDGRIATIYMEREGTFAGIFDGTGASETYDCSGKAELDENNNLIEEI